jgi:V-type H+-transporting ATPase subunit e
MLIMTAVCCWLHWLIAWMSQLNPLFGPVLSKEHAEIIQWSWEDK